MSDQEKRVYNELAVKDKEKHDTQLQTINQAAMERKRNCKPIKASKRNKAAK
jgi:hypothetical protein